MIKKYLYNLIFMKRMSSERRIWKKAYKIILAKNPVVKSKINNQECEMPFSHNGVYYTLKYKNYDKQLKRICDYVKSIEGGRILNIIDVGANIGDTVLNIGDKDNNYLVVEGEKEYNQFIPQNLKGYKYILEECFCGEKDENDVGVSINMESGTAKLTFSETQCEHIDVKTIDSIVDHHNFKPDILKIDTDGFDFKVLRGAQKILSLYKPVLFFEWTINELEQVGENPISIFPFLESMGYEQLIVFDNYGNFMCQMSSGDRNLLKQLIEYTRCEVIYYFDVCAINKESNLESRDLIKNF